MPDLPINLGEALHLLQRASPALRRYVANVSAATNGPLFANRDAIRRASVLQAVEIASTPGDPDAAPAKTTYNYLYMPTVRSVSGGDDRLHDCLAPINFDEDNGEFDPSENILAPADPPTRPDDPWTPPARRPGEFLHGNAPSGPLDTANGGVFNASTDSASDTIAHNRHLIHGGVVASQIFEKDGTTRLVTGRNVRDSKTGDLFTIMRQDPETVIIVSVRVTGTSWEALRLCETLVFWRSVRSHCIFKYVTN
jgi:hypothetical protein